MEKIKSEEKIRYQEVLDKLSKRTKLEVTDNILLKCSDGITIETDMINNDVVITNKNGEKLSLLTLIPEGYNFKISKAPWWADFETKTIFVPMIFDEINLLTWMHEIGHSWDFFNNEEEYIKKGILVDKLKRNNKKAILNARIERAAWAWCFKTVRILRKMGFISSKLNHKVLIELSSASLFSYAKSFQKYKNYKLFLNKEL